MCSGFRIEAITGGHAMSCAKLKNEIICQRAIVALLNLDAIIDLIHNAADAPTASGVNKFLWSF